MGKASRTKAERREEESAAKTAPTVAAPRKPFPVFWTVIGVLVFAGLAALIVTGQKDKAAPKAAKDAPVFGDVEVTGTQLASMPSSDGDTDAAKGDTVPVLAGTGIDGKPITIDPANGPFMVVGMAHWCPHCQKEIPLIVEAQKNGDLPDLPIYGLATASSESKPNFPPADWLARESWKNPTMVDDEVGTAQDALGASSYPFFVIVDADGNVLERASGELEMSDLAKRMEKAVVAKDAAA